MVLPDFHFHSDLDLALIYYYLLSDLYQKELPPVSGLLSGWNPGWSPSLYHQVSLPDLLPESVPN